MWSCSRAASLIIIGPSGAGKSTLASLVARLTGLQVVEIGQHVKLEANSLAPSDSPVDYADRIFAAGKYLHFVETVAGLNLLSKPTIVVGPRLPQELRFLRDHLGVSYAIGLDVPASTRERRRPDLKTLISAEKTWLSYRDQLEFGWGVDSTTKKADLVFEGLFPAQPLALTVLKEWHKFSMTKPKNRAFFCLAANYQDREL